MDKHVSKQKRHGASGDKAKPNNKKGSHGASAALKKKKKHKKRCERPDQGKSSTSPEAECPDIIGGCGSDVRHRQQQTSSAGQVKLHVDGWPADTAACGKPLSKSSSQQAVHKYRTGNLPAATATTQQTTQHLRSHSLDARRSGTGSVGRSSSNTGVICTASATNVRTTSQTTNHQSLRWEDTLSDPEEEEERLRQYKLNRRKRYLKAANKNYDDWLTSTGNSGNSSTSTSSDSAGNLIKSGGEQLNAMCYSLEVSHQISSVPNVGTSSRASQSNQRQAMTSC